MRIIPLKLVRKLLRLNGMRRIERLRPRIMITLSYVGNISRSRITTRQRGKWCYFTDQRSINWPSTKIGLEAAKHGALDVLYIGAR